MNSPRFTGEVRLGLRGHQQQAAVGQQAAPAGFRRAGRPAACRRRRPRDPVEAGQGLVQKGLTGATSRSVAGSPSRSTWAKSSSVSGRMAAADVVAEQPGPPGVGPGPAGNARQVDGLALDIAGLQPLADEVRDEGVAPRVGDHPRPPDAQARPAAGPRPRVEELLIGHRAPEEVGQPAWPASTRRSARRPRPGRRPPAGSGCSKRNRNRGEASIAVTAAATPASNDPPADGLAGRGQVDKPVERRPHRPGGESRGRQAAEAWPADGRRGPPGPRRRPGGETAERTGPG